MLKFTGSSKSEMAHHFSCILGAKFELTLVKIQAKSESSFRNEPRDCER
jgi:hypothetical protein